MSITFLELKNNLNACLEANGLSENLISQLLTDDFLNGILNIQQQYLETNSNTILNDFPTNPNIYDVGMLEKRLSEALNNEGYVKDIFDYIQSTWSSITFPDEMLRSGVNVVQRVTSYVGAFATVINGMYIPRIVFLMVNVFKWIGRADTVYGQDQKYYDIVDRMSEELWRIAVGASHTSAESHPSPLVLDLDGDGVETVGVDQGTYFDHDGNGFAENTGWIGADDGLLVRDLNENGVIDDGTELFGNNSVLSSGATATNGFEALADLDSNEDGTFNSSDTAWNSVKVWKDVDQDGITDEGELVTLENAGVTGINLNYTSQNTTDANNNEHKQTGTFTTTDNTTSTITDVWFDAELSDTKDKTDVELSEAISALPDVEGWGNVHNLINVNDNQVLLLMSA